MRRPAPILIAILIAAAGCGTGPSEVNPEGGLRGAIAQNSSLSRFSAAIEAGPLAAQLEAGNVTVFAPTNIAYRFLGAEALRRLEAMPGVYDSVLRRHIVPGIVEPGALADGAELPTLEGTPLLVRHVGGRVTVGGQPVDLDPFDAGNGLLYEVDGFYSDHIDARTRLGLIPLADRFRDALDRADELDRLEGPDPITVFAPINEGFLRLGASELDLLFSPANGDILDRVARLHLAPGEIRLDGPDATVTVTTLDDFPLTLQAVGGAVTLNGVPVYTQPIQTANGVIYLIGGVILDGLTLEQRIRSSSSLRTFWEWATVHPQLLAALTGTEPHTVFAPTSGSIAGIPENVRTAIRRPANAVLFERVMEMHFVSGRLTSPEMPNGASIPTLEGSTLEVTNTSSAFRVDARDILRRDLPARNGILHIVDGLLTPDVDAFDGAILRGTPAFTDVVRHAGLEWLVRGPGPISVIAFSDEAIASMPDLFTRPDLPNIIRYHIANGDIGQIFVGMTFIPLEGPPRTVTEFAASSGFLLDGAPFFNDQGLVTNGHLYRIGGIQAPPDPLRPRQTAVRR
jgi:uncharacterized surface protein with fasciclin (FAS1) repeats